MKNTFIKTIIKIGENNKKIVFISVDQPTGFDAELKKILKDRFFIEPISEANVIGMASALSSEGFIPIVFNHATFNSRRCYEQIFLDCCLQSRKVILFSMGAGLATSHLGPSHTSLDDIGLMKIIPNMDIAVPSNALEVEKITPQILKSKNSCYLRISKYGIPRNGVDIDRVYFKNYNYKKIIPVSNEYKKTDVTIISTGITTPIGIDINKSLKKKKIISNIYHVPCISPIDTKALEKIFKQTKKLIFIEEHYENSGLANSIVDAAVFNLKLKKLPNIKRFAIPQNKFVTKYGDQTSVLNYFGISKNRILNEITFDR